MLVDETTKMTPTGKSFADIWLSTVRPSLHNCVPFSLSLLITDIALVANRSST
jgi:hypothetical protein